MHICTHICIYVPIYAYMEAYMYIYIYMREYIRICSHICIYAFMSAYIYAYMWACMHILAHICCRRISVIGSQCAVRNTRDLAVMMIRCYSRLTCELRGRHSGRVGTLKSVVIASWSRPSNASLDEFDMLATVELLSQARLDFQCCSRP